MSPALLPVGDDGVDTLPCRLPLSAGQGGYVQNDQTDRPRWANIDPHEDTNHEVTRRPSPKVREGDLGIVDPLWQLPVRSDLLPCRSRNGLASPGVPEFRVGRTGTMIFRELPHLDQNRQLGSPPEQNCLA